MHSTSSASPVWRAWKTTPTTRVYHAWCNTICNIVEPSGRASAGPCRTPCGISMVFWYGGYGGWFLIVVWTSCGALVVSKVSIIIFEWPENVLLPCECNHHTISLNNNNQKYEPWFRGEKIGTHWARSRTWRRWRYTIPKWEVTVYMQLICHHNRERRLATSV